MHFYSSKWFSSDPLLVKEYALCNVIAYIFRRITTWQLHFERLYGRYLHQ